MQELFTSFSGISALIVGSILALAAFKLWQQSREEKEKKS